jgi:cupin 2 domain-containing protein
MAVVRGRLRPADVAPATGEETYRLADLGHAVVDQILSGRLDGPVDYRQDEEEWVVVVAGRATLVVEGEPVQLGPGDWVLLRAHTPHRLVETDPGTSWLTVTSPSSRR